jgi:hypothetical protein
MTNDEFIGGISPNGMYIDIKRPNPVYYDSMGMDDPLPYICNTKIVNLYGNVISTYDKASRKSYISNDGRHSLDRNDRMFGTSRLVFRNNGAITEIESLANITTGGYSPSGDMYAICDGQTMRAYDNTYQSLWSTTFNTIISFSYRIVNGKSVYFSPDGQRIQANLLACGLLFDRNGNLLNRIDKRFRYISFLPDSRYLSAITTNSLHFIDATDGNLLWEHTAIKGWYPTVASTNNNVITVRDESMTENNSLCWLEVFSNSGVLLFSYLLEDVNLTKYGSSELFILQATDDGKNAIIVWRNKIMVFRISGNK